MDNTKMWQERCDDLGVEIANLRSQLTVKDKRIRELEEWKAFTSQEIVFLQADLTTGRKALEDAKHRGLAASLGNADPELACIDIANIAAQVLEKMGEEP